MLIWIEQLQLPLNIKRKYFLSCLIMTEDGFYLGYHGYHG
jgi:hypothetical protein